MNKSVISVAHYNSVKIGVQRAGNFCNAAINGDRSLVNSLGDYNFEQAGTAAAVKELEQQAEAAATKAVEARAGRDRGGAGTTGGRESQLPQAPKGGRGGRGRERPPPKGAGRKRHS